MHVLHSLCFKFLNMSQVFKQVFLLICLATTLMVFNYIQSFYNTSKPQLFLQYPLLSLSSHHNQSTKAVFLNSDQMQISNHDPHQNLNASTNDGERIAIPPEALQRNSPFYGMIYKNEYGLPVKGGIRSIKIENNWKSYFPNLIENLKKLEEFNLGLDNTSFTYSSSIKVIQTNYTLGDEFRATITSLDRENRPKKFGGDYYRARLVRKSENRPSDGIPCKVTDNHDGTYSASAPLFLQGSLVLEVTLVHSIEAIREIIQKTESKKSSWLVRFEGILETQEKVTCDLELSNK